jgi:tetratricopeptide (TPR) repeat protein
MPASSALTAPRLLNKEQQEKKDQLLDAGNEAFDAEAYQLALECYHKASLIDPGDAEVWSALGLAYANLEYPQEAWRSYRLALLADPENLNALWYSCEFLYNQENLDLCRLMLQRYLQLEEDNDARAEADELLQEVTHLLGEEAALSAHRAVGVEADADDVDESEDELPAGFDREDDGSAPVNEDDFEDEDSEGDPDFDSGTFYASVELRLGDLSSKCHNCATALPWDAPYCYACNAPCFYSESPVEA